MSSQTNIFLARQRATLQHSIGELHRFLDADDNWRALAALESVGAAAGGVAGYAWIARREELVAALSENPIYCLCVELERALVVVSNHMDPPWAFGHDRAADTPSYREQEQPQRANSIAERIATLAMPQAPPTFGVKVEEGQTEGVPIPAPLQQADVASVVSAAATTILARLQTLSSGPVSPDAVEPELPVPEAIEITPADAVLAEVPELHKPDSSVPELQEAELPEASDASQPDELSVEIPNTPDATDVTQAFDSGNCDVAEQSATEHNSADDVLTVEQPVETSLDGLEDENAPIAVVEQDTAQLAQDESDDVLAVEIETESDPDLVNTDLAAYAAPEQADAPVEPVPLDDALAIEEEAVTVRDVVKDDQSVIAMTEYNGASAALTEKELSAAEIYSRIEIDEPSVGFDKETGNPDFIDAELEAEVSIVTKAPSVPESAEQLPLQAEADLTDSHETLEQRLKRLDRLSQNLLSPKEDATAATISTGEDPSRAEKWLDMICARRSKSSGGYQAGAPRTVLKDAPQASVVNDEAFAARHRPSLPIISLHRKEYFDPDGGGEAEVKIVIRRPAGVEADGLRFAAPEATQTGAARQPNHARNLSTEPALAIGSSLEEASVEIVRQGSSKNQNDDARSSTSPTAPSKPPVGAVNRFIKTLTGE